MEDKFWNDQKVKDLIYNKLSIPLQYCGNVQKMIDEFKKSKESKPIQDKDYEIISYFFNGLRWGKVGGKYYNEFGDFISTVPENAEIQSVRRISDNEVFSIDDKIEFGFHGGLGDAEIKSFVIDYFDNTKISAYNGPYGLGIKGWKKAKPKVPLFTLNDVDIYERDTFYSVNKKSFKILQWTAYSEFKNQWSYPELEYFSTEQKAKEYILQNKPIQVRYIDIRFMTREELLRYFKSKINIT